MISEINSLWLGMKFISSDFWHAANPTPPPIQVNPNRQYAPIRLIY
jgi:hypothetical protein